MGKQIVAGSLLAIVVMLSAARPETGPRGAEPTPAPRPRSAEAAAEKGASEGTTAGERASGDASLSIRIEQAVGGDSQPVIDVEKPIRIVLTNRSQGAIWIGNPVIEPGDYPVSVHFTNVRSGENHVARKRRIEDAAYRDLVAKQIELGSEVIEIGPADTYTFQINFSGFAWGERAWTGPPGPNSSDRFSVSVQFEVTEKPADAQRKVWSGKIQSEPLIVGLIAPRLKTPHDYLWNGFSRSAIEMMAADPKWVKTRDENQCTPLHHAARFGPPEAVRWLLEHGADVNAVAYNGFTPLHLTDDPEVVRLILARKPDLAIRCRSQGETPLQRAAARLAAPGLEKEREKWRQIVELFETSGAEYDILTAIHRDDLGRVQAILKESPKVADDFQGESPLRAAASLGRLEICRYLITEHKVDVDDFERGHGYPITKEALAFPEVVRLLFESGADLKTRITWRGGRSGRWIVGDDATLLHYAACDGVPETIKLLIDNGVDIFAAARDPIDRNARQTALEVAAFFGKGANAEAIVGHARFNAADPAVRQALLDQCLRIGAVPGPSPGKRERSKLIELLLAKGANPNAAENGVTAVQIAARQIRPNHEQENAEIRRIVGLLEEKGATVDLISAVAVGDEEQVRRHLKKDPASANSRGHDGYPALHFAVGMNDKKIAEALLAAGGDVDIRNQSRTTGGRGETALHCAAFWGRGAMAELLLEAGANVNGLTDGKSTPLHDAARVGNVRMVRLLLDGGANVDARDNENKTPLDWCLQPHSNNAPETEKVLREHEARKPK